MISLPRKIELLTTHWEATKAAQNFPEEEVQQAAYEVLISEILPLSKEEKKWLLEQIKDSDPCKS